ncbi:hypothetical protein HPB47_018281 [Ixodes persulcatus]|uniref:Uncharacterized protein n=1 Tax=Ixodes persulcatus TaxID=34615 RepID=A0AC60QL60_IXOPE|nr:hypothetical protein HPB47_018281 [Ixodes persulcatus]
MTAWLVPGTKARSHLRQSLERPATSDWFLVAERPKQVFLCCFFAFAASQVVVHNPPQPYSFGYDNTDEFGTRMTRQETGDEFNNKILVRCLFVNVASQVVVEHETRDVNNSEVGSYGCVDANGAARIVNYIADAFGYRASVQTNEPGTKTSEPAEAPTYSSSVEVQAPVAMKAVHPAPFAVHAIRGAPFVYA